MIRLGGALLITPLLAVSIYVCVFYLLLSNTSNFSNDIWAYAAGFLPFAYGGTIMIWLPLVVFFEYRGWRRLQYYLTAGVVIGMVLGATWLALARSIAYEMELIFLICKLSMAGCAFGGIFWITAFLGSRKK